MTSFPPFSNALPLISEPGSLKRDLRRSPCYQELLSSCPSFRSFQVSISLISPQMPGIRDSSKNKICCVFGTLLMCTQSRICDSYESFLPLPDPLFLFLIQRAKSKIACEELCLEEAPKRALICAFPSACLPPPPGLCFPIGKPF